jgi:Zn-dependent metalloprotease
MMKKILLTFITLSPVLAFAQLQQAASFAITPGYQALQQMESRVAVSERPSQQVMNADQTENVKEYLKQKYPELQQVETGLQLLHKTTSKIGTHYSFLQTYKGIPIHKATCNITVNQTGNVMSCYNLLVSTDGWNSEPFKVETSAGKPIWIVSGQSPIAAYKKVSGNVIHITDAQGNYIATKDGAYYYEDTLVSGKVFLPDPLTSQQVVYGQNGTYQHFDDSDYALLNNQRKDIQFPATLDNGFFTLENRYAKIMELQSPTIAPVTSTTPVFDYTRSQNGFKEIMVMYHLYATQMYYQYLGFNELKDYQIKVDAHSSTSDNSSFNFPTDSSLNFGTGGVPDAEDGDVPCHEYTHALSWFLNPQENMNNERRAIEEATCDVIAANLSRRSSEFNWRLMYNFDAPNPITAGLTKFWSGRNGNSSKTYQNYLGSPYSDAEIWLSTMLDIAEVIGNDTAAMLLLYSVYSMPENCTMPQAAELYLQADSILFNKAFTHLINPIFTARKLGNFVGIPEQEQVFSQLTIQNSAGFAQGSGDAIIDLPFATTYSVMDMQGRIIQRKQSDGRITLHPEEFTHGMYIITIRSGEGKQTSMKFVR